MTKAERVIEANRVIDAISRYGRRFFRLSGDRHLKPGEPERVSRFEVDHRGVIWFVDKYTQKRVYVAYKYRWRGFSEGGTLRSLVQALAGYIRDGTPISRGWFGPWRPEVCGGDLWGYGEEAWKGLRAELTSMSAVEQGEKEIPPGVTA